jgi:putative ABC transport system permease protein
MLLRTTFDTLVRDLRYASRMLRKTPAFTLTTVATLAVAIGVNTAIFSSVDAVMLKPLPYPGPDRLALVTRRVVDRNGRADSAVNGRTWEAVRDHARGVRAAVFSTWTTGVNLAIEARGGRRVEYVRQQRVGAGFFGVLGVPPLVGREFAADEDRTGGPPAAILSFALWNRLLDADASVIGRPVMLKGEPYTIVGVMPPDFHSGTNADLWTPLRPSTTGEGAGENYAVLLRLRDGVGWPEARQEVASAAIEATRGVDESGARLEFSAIPLQEGFATDLREPLLILWTAVGLVMLVACVNVAGLLLARAGRRTRELATRMALGSGRAAVVRQLLVESLVLAAAGGGAGILVALETLAALRWLSREAFDIWQPLAIDSRAMAAAAILSLIATAAFGLAPALQATRIGVGPALLQSHGGSRSVAGTGARWPRRLMVLTQVALGVVLLVSAGLLLRTFTHLRALDPGFDPSGVLTVSLSLEDARYRSAQRVVDLFNRTLDRLERSPEIAGAAVSLGVPYERLLNISFRRADGVGPAQGSMTSAAYVTRGFFDALKIPITRGRAFSDGDRGGTTPVVVVTETFARTYFSGEDALGKRIRLSGTEREIVGVAADVQVRPGWGENGPLARMPVVYLPVVQVSDAFVRLVHGWFAPTFIVRSTMTRERAAAAVRDALSATDPLLPVADIRSMGDVQAAAVATERLMMWLLAGLGVTAVLLVAIGLHGLVATAVTERTREMGIRVALGATKERAMATLAMPGLLLGAAGVAAGLTLAAAGTRFLRHVVWGVSVTDPLTFAAAAALVLAVVTLSSVVPARQILRLDPARALQGE